MVRDGGTSGRGGTDGLTLDTNDQLWLETNGLGGIGCAWYERVDGFLRRLPEHLSISVVESRGGWTIHVRSQRGQAAVPVAANVDDDWAASCRRQLHAQHHE